VNLYDSLVIRASTVLLLHKFSLSSFYFHRIVFITILEVVKDISRVILHQTHALVLCPVALLMALEPVIVHASRQGIDAKGRQGDRLIALFDQEPCEPAWCELKPVSKPVAQVMVTALLLVQLIILPLSVADRVRVVPDSVTN
jgi:hypothetical protein